MAFFSVVYIRKSLVPLDLLKEGINWITLKKYHNQVEIKSGDEFEELADNFNKMTKQLEKQFKTLQTRSKIDRSILSSINTEDIITITIKGMKDIFENDSIAITLFNPDENNIATAYVSGKNNDEIKQILVSYTPWDIKILQKNREYILFDKIENLPQFLKSLSITGSRQFLVFPIYVNKGTPSAVIILSCDGESGNLDENIVRSRQIADQVAVALSNSRLIDELHSITWATLNAFSRAVDAKSPWTAGHSSRVSKLAINIGRRLGLDERQIEMLELAGILHDIGKIGIPAYILDKPGKLTDDEMETIRKHPAIGARILEPLKVFLPVVPMVLQHHEQFSGKGYPQGISGEKIDFGARILAVADVFDALTSKRPYRKALPMEKAIAILSDESGEMFDPLVVDAFVEVIKSDDNQLDFDNGFINKQLNFGT